MNYLCPPEIHLRESSFTFFSESCMTLEVKLFIRFSSPLPLPPAFAGYIAYLFGGAAPHICLEGQPRIFVWRSRPAFRRRRESWPGSLTLSFRSMSPIALVTANDPCTRYLMIKAPAYLVVACGRSTKFRISY